MRFSPALGFLGALATSVCVPLAAGMPTRAPSSAGDVSSWVAEARARLGNGDLPGAYEAGAHIVSSDPDNVAGLILGGQLARRRYGLRASLDWFHTALDKDPRNVGALVELAATQGDMGANRDMLATTRRLLAADPENRWAWYFRAVMAARAGKPTLARAMLDRVGEALDDQPGVILLKAVLDLQRGAPELARQRLFRLKADQPNNFQVRRLLAEAQGQVGDLAGAAATLGPLVERADADSYALMQAVRLAEAMDDRARAASLLDRLTNPVRISSQPFQREGPAGAIGEALRAGDFRYAQDLVLAWQRAFPSLPAAHLALGDVHAAQENWAGATKAYRDAANLAFTEATALRLARSLAAMQQMSAAHQALSLYLWQNPQNVVVRLALADLDLEAKNWPRAIVQLEILRDRLGDGDPALLARLGAAWHGAGDDRRAMTYAQAAYQRLPSDPRLRLQLALIAKSVGRQKFAQRLLQAAM